MPVSERASASDIASAGVSMQQAVDDIVHAPKGCFDVECVGPDGEVKWREQAHNIVTTAGKQDALNVVFGGQAKRSWFLILKGAGAVTAGDTLASPGAWTEFTSYTGTRPAWSVGAATVFSTTGAEVTNGSVVAFAITGSGTVAGVGACTVTSGTSGILYNIGDFASSRTVASGDTLNVTLTLRLAA